MCGEHELLYEAIRSGDADAAERIARRHVAGTRATAMQMLAAGTVDTGTVDTGTGTAAEPTDPGPRLRP